jgi:hypothetical protein
MVAVVKRTYYLNEDLDMALKLRAVKERMGYGDVVIAALEQYLGVKKSSILSLYLIIRAVLFSMCLASQRH